MRGLSELVNAEEPGIEKIREWMGDALNDCVLLPPSAERDQVLLQAQLTTRSILGAIAYETGGVMVDGGWLRFYESLRWPSWRKDTAVLSGDLCFGFCPPLWTKEGSVKASHRAPVPVREAYELNLDLARQLNHGNVESSAAPNDDTTTASPRSSVIERLSFLSR